MVLSAVIVGGGISGLAVAHYLSLKKMHPFTVLEATSRFGGVIRTLREGRSQIEAGADAFDGGEQAMLDLCGELGLRDELLKSAPTLSNVFIYQNGRSLPVDISSPAGILKNRALRFKAHGRLLFEVLVPRRKESSDESIAAFVRRRFGKTVLEDLTRPLIRGILMEDPERLSLHEYFPMWAEMERCYGGFAKAFFRKKYATKPSRPFFSVRGGMGRLTDALLKAVEGTILERDSEVVSIERGSEWKVTLKNGRSVRSETVCLAVPAHQAARLLSNCVPSLAAELGKIRYDTVIAVDMMFRREKLPQITFEKGFLVPGRGENWPFASLKSIGDTEDGLFASFRAFISGILQPQTLAWDDNRITKEVLSCLSRVAGVQAAPEWISVERYPDSLAQYQVGHAQLASDIERKLHELPGLFLTGNGYRGFGISDCVREARLTAQKMAIHLETSVESSAQIG